MGLLENKSEKGVYNGKIEKLKTTIMETKIEPDDLTIEEFGLLQKELFDFSEMFKNRIIEMLKKQIKYLERL